MKTIIILILLLLVVGLYYAHSETVKVVKGTGHVIAEGAKAAYHAASNDENLKQGFVEAKEKVKEKLKNE